MFRSFKSSGIIARVRSRLPYGYASGAGKNACFHEDDFRGTLNFSSSPARRPRGSL